MARPINRLSARAVAAATAAGYHPDGGGLYLQVAAGGTKSWILRYTIRGRAREMGLGPLSAVSLAEARERAVACRRQLRDGVDPIDARDRVRSLNAHTFDACAAEFIAANAAGWKSAKHAEQWTNTLATYASPVIGSMPVGAIGVANVVRVLEPIWAVKTETASRVRQRIESVLDYAAVKKYRGDDSNPARWRGNLDKIFPKPAKVAKAQHFPALPYAELPPFMRALAALDEMSALALRFTILTCVRTGETIGAMWSEFNLQAGLWTIPAERMKAGKAHTVVLSEPALAVLAIVRQLGHVGPVFRYRKKPLSNGAMLALLGRLKRGDITVHGFRSTFRDWAEECTEHQPNVIEMALAHVITNKTEAAYRRGELLEKRRRLAADWAAYCMGETAITPRRGQPSSGRSMPTPPSLTSATRRRS